MCAVLAGPAWSLDKVDATGLIEVFEAQCLQPLMQGQAPSAEGFRAPTGEAALGYSGSVTRDDRVMLQVYQRDGLWGCGTTNSVYTVPAEGAGFDRMAAVLEGYAEELAEGPFTETTQCMTPIEGSWARRFVSKGAARDGTYVDVMVSWTKPYANGGPSLQEKYGTPDLDCEGVQ